MSSCSSMPTQLQSLASWLPWTGLSLPGLRSPRGTMGSVIPTPRPPWLCDTQRSPAGITSAHLHAPVLERLRACTEMGWRFDPKYSGTRPWTNHLVEEC